MALLRDPNYVEKVSKIHEIEENLDKEVCKAIQIEVENELRELIVDARKFQRQFKRPYLTSSDIDEALKDKGYSETIFGVERSYNVEYNYDKNFELWSLKDTKLNLKETLIKELDNLIKQPEKTHLKMWWLQLNDSIPDTIENKFVKKKEEIFRQQQEQKDEEEYEFNIVKDKPLSLLSKELHAFFQTITETIAKEELAIDKLQSQLYSESEELQIVYKNLQKNTGISTLVPFLINYLYQDYDVQNLNAVLKKNITLKLLEALITNPYINLEHHLHIIIKMLIHFITSQKLQENCVGEEQIQLRDQSAKCLSILLIKFGGKYFNLTQNLSELFQEILISCLKIESENQFCEKFQTLYGVFSFFSYLPVNIIKDMTFVHIQQLLQNPMFNKCINYNTYNYASMKSRLHSNNNGSGNKNNKKNSNSMEIEQENNIHSKITAQEIDELIQFNQDAMNVFSVVQKIIKKLFTHFDQISFGSEQEKIMFIKMTDNFSHVLETIQTNLQAQYPVEPITSHPNISLNSLTTMF